MDDPIGVGVVSELARVDLDGAGRFEYVALDRGGARSHFWSVKPAAPPGPRIELQGQAGILVAADVDADGDLDLVAGDSERDELESIINTEGSIAPESTVLLPGGTRGLATGDFDGDGAPEIMVVSGDGTTLSRLDLPLQGEAQVLESGFRRVGFGMMAAADLDGDGRTDLVLGSDDSPLHPDPAIHVLWGGASFAARQRWTLDAPFRSSSFAVADVDGDDLPDVVVATGLPDREETTVWVYRNEGGRVFSELTAVPAGFHPTQLAACDLDGDGLAEIAGINLRDSQIGIVSLRPGGRPLRLVGVNSDWAPPQSILCSDWNGDGASDLVVGGWGIHVLLGDGKGELHAPTSLPAGRYPLAVAAADFDGDSRPDVAVAAATDQAVEIWTSRHGGLDVAPQVLALGTEPGDLVTGDFDGDGLADLLAPPRQVGAAHVLLGNGAGGFRALEPIEMRGVYRATVGDLDGDGLDDVVVTHDNDDSVQVLHGDPRLGLRPDAEIAVSGGPSEAVVADFNADGEADLAVALFGRRSVQLLMGGAGTFVPCERIPVGAGPIALRAGWLRGEPALLASNWDDRSLTLLRLDAAGIWSAQMIAVSNSPRAAELLDVDGDGQTDILALTSAGNLQFLAGTPGGEFVPSSVNWSFGAALDMALSDVDADGSIDALVVNGEQSTLAVLRSTCAARP